MKYRHDENNLFEDDEFPASNSSLYFSTFRGDVTWLRPKEARRDAQFVVNGFDHCDMDQGQLGKL